MEASLRISSTEEEEPRFLKPGVPNSVVSGKSLNLAEPLLPEVWHGKAMAASWRLVWVALGNKGTGVT